MKLFHGLDEDDADDDAGGDEQSLPSAFLDRLHLKLATSVSQRGIVAQLIHERSHFPGVEPKMQRLGSLLCSCRSKAIRYSRHFVEDLQHGIRGGKASVDNHAWRVATLRGADLDDGRGEEPVHAEQLVLDQINDCRFIVFLGTANWIK